MRRDPVLTVPLDGGVISPLARPSLGTYTAWKADLNASFAGIYCGPMNVERDPVVLVGKGLVSARCLTLQANAQLSPRPRTITILRRFTVVLSHSSALH